MSVDLRSRTDQRRGVRAPAAVIQEMILPGLHRHTELVAKAAHWLPLAPLTLLVEDAAWTLRLDSQGRVQMVNGEAGEGPVWRMTSQDLDDIVEDQTTPMALFTSGRLDQPRGKLGQLFDWWLVLRCACDGVPVHTPGDVDLTDADGKALDLGRSFAPNDDTSEMRQYLESTGFLHIRGLYSPAEMDAVSADMNRAAPAYTPDDGRSWWATVDGGARRLVRMQGFQRHSPTAEAILAGDRLASIAALTGDGHRPAEANESNPIEALFKPIGVIQGISDVPWHKDCSLGRHSYECCRLTVGISVTPGGPGTGQLRVVAGSHRALIWPALEQPELDLPVVPLPTDTGDVTVHLSCTLHMADPPSVGERRVMYTDCRLPLDPTAAAEGRRRLNEVREAAPTTVSQPSAAPA
jgi:hypothetical protein